VSHFQMTNSLPMEAVQRLLIVRIVDADPYIWDSGKTL